MAFQQSGPQSGPIEFDIAAREAHVVGGGPRIAALDDAEMGDETRAMVNKIRASAGAQGTAVVPEYMRTMMKHPEIFRCQMDMGTVLFKGLIPARERELAVLRIAWLCRAPYEWGQHVDISKRYGISEVEVLRVQQGSTASGWSAHDSMILLGVEELLSDAALSDATWNALARSWGEAQMIEFLIMVGQYVATAFVQNSLRIRLMETNPGLSYL